MRIYTNMASLRAASQLDRADRNASNSIQKLSSGYKINRSEDNPVGRAISNKMKMQIKSLERAEQNASDGISIVQSAEGALSEIQSMLQRVSELSVQAASDTYTTDDKNSIQDEVNQLLEEINRIAEDTDFNGKPLLDGTLSRKAYAEGINGIDQLYVSPSVNEGRYGFIISAEPEKAVYSSSGFAADTVPEGVNGSLAINGVIVNVTEGQTKEEIYDAIKEASYIAGIDVALGGASLDTGTPIEFTHNYYGSGEKITIACTDEKVAEYLGVDKDAEVSGKDVEVSIIPTDTGFSDTAKAVASGENITFTDKDGFEMTVKVNAGTYTENKDAANEMRVAYNVTNAGSMTIQLGANAGQSIDIDIPKISIETLGIDHLNVKTSYGASEAITKVNDAIARISKIRSSVGAYQNRMEASVSSLGVTTENMNSALSRIEDVDMAAEMTEYTTQNVLSQAATSMLAQANQMPEKVLQLLQ